MELSSSVNFISLHNSSCVRLNYFSTKILGLADSPSYYSKQRIQKRSRVKTYQELPPNSLLASQTCNSSLTASWEQTTWKFFKSPLKPLSLYNLDQEKKKHETRNPSMGKCPVYISATRNLRKNRCNWGNMITLRKCLIIYN